MHENIMWSNLLIKIFGKLKLKKTKHVKERGRKEERESGEESRKSGC